MTNIIENDLFQRPATYWLRRAERLKQSGDLIRAAVLERHAVRADPDSDAASMNYPFTLRMLHCYEASNREAFAALARHPDRKALYGLIGQNLLSMGCRQAGLDALNVYMADGGPSPDYLPPWNEQAYDMAYAYDLPPGRKRRARLDGLLSIAAHRLETGDLEGAKKALVRSEKKPFHALSARREMLTALCCLHSGDPQEAMQHLVKGLVLQSRHTQAAAFAAGMFQSMGCRHEALISLARAAMYAKSPADELAVCLSGDQLNAPHLALGMLRRALRHRADRYPVCYNLCVCLLKTGRLREALQYNHLCREIDPDDVQGEVLFTRLSALEEMNASQEAVRIAARSISYWGAATPQEMTLYAAPVLETLADGQQALTETLQQDDHLRRRFIHLMSLPAEWTQRLLMAAGAEMKNEVLEPLLREILLQQPPAADVRRTAAAMLSRIGAQPPYAVWQDGRLGWLDPTQPPQPTPAFLQRIFTRRIHSAWKLCPQDSGITPWAIEMVRRMNKSQRRSLITDPLGIWPAAFNIIYRARKGLPPLHTAFYGRLTAAALLQAMRTLRSLSDQGGNHHADH